MSKQPTKKSNKNQKRTNHHLYPIVGQRVYFSAATVISRRIEKYNKPIKGSSAHRTQMAKVERGYLIIDQNWYIEEL